MKKKVICALLSTLLLSMSVPFSAHSTVDVTKDPNGDGQLSLSDIVTLMQYLRGYYVASDPSQMDINNNNIISKVDLDELINYDSGGATS